MRATRVRGSSSLRARGGGAAAEPSGDKEERLRILALLEKRGGLPPPPAVPVQPEALPAKEDGGHEKELSV